MSADTLELTAGRRRLLRGLALYAPLLLLAGLGLTVSLRSLRDGQIGAVLPLVILGVFAFAVLVQTFTAWRDLYAAPTYTRGEIQRRWSKGAVLWFYRTHYLLVRRAVFAVSPGTAAHVEEGDVVEIHYWPHTRTVIGVHLLAGADAEREPHEAPVVPLELP